MPTETDYSFCQECGKRINRYESLCLDCEIEFRINGIIDRHSDCSLTDVDILQAI